MSASMDCALNNDNFQCPRQPHCRGLLYKENTTIKRNKARNIKRLLKHTTILLRTALLLGAVTFASVPMKAGTVVLPDAFDTMDPADIIGDGNYYYIQFYEQSRNIYSYLTDCGVNVNARAKDFLPYANNRLWTLENAYDGDATHFKLRNKDGHYLYFGSGGAARDKCVDNVGNASILFVSIL